MYSHKSVLRIGGTDSLGDVTSLLKVGYEVIDFRQAFEQGVDDKGKPQTDVRGGTFHCVIPQIPSEEIINWGLESRSYKKGCFFFYDTDGKIIEKIVFTDAVCSGMEINYADKGSGYVSTRLIIHAKNIDYLNGVDFNNEWTGFN